MPGEGWWAVSVVWCTQAMAVVAHLRQEVEHEREEVDEVERARVLSELVGGELPGRLAGSVAPGGKADVVSYERAIRQQEGMHEHQRAGQQHA